VTGKIPGFPPTNTTLLTGGGQFFRWSHISLVLIRLDYGNATLAGLPSSQLNRLQSVMNTLQPHGFYSRHGSPSTSHHCSVTFTGYGCPSGLSLNSLYSPTVACSAIPCTRAAPCGRHRLTTTTALRVDIRARSAIDASCYHRRPCLWRRLCAFMEHSAACRLTSRHRHHCLSSSDISKLPYTQIFTRDIVINYLTSVKCSKSF